MAVVQISRIQIRRGRKGAGTSIPQLASGELAWAVDTQELFIGNGSVSEGAPAVGNTKIITHNDLVNENAFLDLLKYTYKAADTTITESSVRLLQDRLDDRIISTNFGTVGDGTFDNSTALQNAIYQLFLNESGHAFSETTHRVILELPAGTFRFTQTLLIPSFATIVGAGLDKTILLYEGTGTAIQFINNTSTASYTAPDNTTNADNYPRNISISNLTVSSATSDQVALKMYCVCNSTFENLLVQGNWGSLYHPSSKGIELIAYSSMLNCANNVFTNVSITGFSHAVYAKTDNSNNVFDNGSISDGRYGFNLGDNADGATVGQQLGPIETHIKNIKFSNLHRSAVYLYLGSENTVSNCVMNNVGNNGNGNAFPAYPQIYFKTYGNYTHNIRSDRTSDLSLPNLSVTYVPEVAGHGKYVLPLTKYTVLGFSNDYEQLFRLPLNTNSAGTPAGYISYDVEYTYNSTGTLFTRKGKLSLSVDIDNATVQLTDEFDYTGSGAGQDSLPLIFTATFLDEINDLYTGAPGQYPYTLCINFRNRLAGDAGTLIYTYTSIF